MTEKKPLIMSDYQDMITEKDEYPEFNKTGLQKFFLYSYDSELGWTKKPFTSGFEESRFGVGMFRVNEKGSRFNLEFEKLSAKISIHGDSFAMSRQVNDNETIAYYLSELTNSNVLNWGVGNYGIDQSFLRMKKEFPKNKTDIVVMAFVPEQILRVMSYWKHYLEYGNHFAFKPRFKLENGKLILIPNIMDSEEKYNKLRELIPEIKKHDYWYEKKFKKDFGVSYNTDQRMESNLKWRINSFKDKECFETLLGVMKLFKEYSKKQGFKPVIAVLPFKNDITYVEKSSNNFYDSFIEACKNELLTIDLMPNFLNLNEDELNNSFSDETDYGGHYSKKGNKFVANILHKFLKDNNII